MPELPEVETTVAGLRRTVVGKNIESVWTDWKKIFRQPHFAQAQKLLQGVHVVGATRRGKNILIELEHGYTMLIHMKMTGHLMVGKYTKTKTGWIPQDKNSPLADPFNRFIHVLFTLSNKMHLAFSDTRKFGRIDIEKTKELNHSPRLAHLGPEPLSKSMILSVFLKRVALRSRGKIKQVLMDQTVIVGIGNIYSDEMLFLAKIHPESIVKHIPKKQLRKLFIAMKKVLSLGIDFGGDSTSDYRNIDGVRGAFHHRHNVYRETKKPCKRKKCSGVILRKMVGGRSAHFCSVCQIKY